ncbi:2-succinyl-5-enolpyruvyl-6-hydroxy-3-cyclohexene-1-carboxylic-acid synthase [Thiolapillus sp.]
MEQGRCNLDWCLALLDGLASAGVEQVVLSPGSRNTPLTLATVLHPQLEHHVAVDERAGAFFALGIAMLTRKPVVLICTSGTAVANWFPAVVEANQQQIPLILLSADRPWELQQCLANQTMDQIKLFGSHVRAFHQLPVADFSRTAMRRLRMLGRQLVRESSGIDAGPVHANISLREPLVPESLPRSLSVVEVKALTKPQLLLPQEELHSLAAILSGKKGVIVCGPGATCAEVLYLGEALGCPVLADPLSGLRYVSPGAVISHYDLLLRSKANAVQLQAEWVLHFGGTPVSSALQLFLGGQDRAPYWWVDVCGRSMDIPGVMVETLSASAQGLCQQLLSLELPPPAADWLKSWQVLDRQVEERLQQLDLPLEAQVIRHALQELPAQSLLFSGNSMAVRFLDAYSGVHSKDIAVYGNRGASGIDGNLSTLAGLASAHRGEGKVLGIVGDLAFFHDLNALALARDQDMILLLLNNQGGGIFDFLPQRELPEYEACWRTPVVLDYMQASAAFSVASVQVRDMDAFAQAFSRAMAGEGMQLIEVVIDSGHSNELHRNVVAQWAN